MIDFGRGRAAGDQPPPAPRQQPQAQRARTLRELAAAVLAIHSQPTDGPERAADLRLLSRAGRPLANDGPADFARHSDCKPV